MSGKKFDLKDTILVIGELFRKHGYHGTTLSYIKEASGLGKGSFYHHFPMGKEEIARKVIEEVHEWFDENVYIPLETPPFNKDSITNMFDNTSKFFHKGKRACIPGSFALYDARESFSHEIRFYFDRWIKSLSFNLQQQGVSSAESKKLAQYTVAQIQGAIILTKALDKSSVFEESLRRTGDLLLSSINDDS
jgi:AcrR family transcriptional regulator